MNSSQPSFLYHGEKLCLDRIDNITNILDDLKVAGSLWVSNFRIIFKATGNDTNLSQLGSFELPVFAIKTFKKQKHHITEINKAKSQIRISSKNNCDVLLQFPMNDISYKHFYDAVEEQLGTSNGANFYPFSSQERLDYLDSHTKDGWKLYESLDTWQQVSMSEDSEWRQTNVNLNFDLCPYYPPVFLVPNSTTDAQITKAVKTRELGQFPVVVWRASSGASLSRALTYSVEKVNDENLLLLRSIGLKNQKDKELRIYDVGKSQLFQPNYKPTFLDLPNNSMLQDYFAAMEYKSNSDSFHFSDSKWRETISSFLLHTAVIARLLYSDGKSVLIQGQKKNLGHFVLLSLIQLVSDPYTRTIEGFCFLIEKIWIQYSYPFGKYFHSREKRSLHFELFLGIVWFIYVVFPGLFEFDERILFFLMDSLYSGRFGTFLSSKRSNLKLNAETLSIWTYIFKNKEKFRNKLYSPNKNQKILNIDVYCRSPALWNEYYKRYHINTKKTYFACIETIKSTSMTSFNVNSTYNALLSVPEPVTSLAYLTVLHLKGNQLESMPISIYRLLQLEELSLCMNPIYHISENWMSVVGSYLKKLKILDLEKTNLTNFPLNINHYFQSLLVIKTSSILNPNFSIPTKAILPSNTMTLAKVELHNNNLRDVPFAFSTINSITHLMLSGNALTYVPYVLCSLDKLEYLDLSKNAIAHIDSPEGELFFMNLVSLNLSNNALTQLSNSLGHVPRLSKLYLSHNNISVIHDNFFPHLRNLEILYLSHNTIEKIPDGVELMKKLTYFDLSYNKLKELNSSISHLSSLKNLYLQHNFITDITVGFGKMKMLTHLDISHNAMTLLPPQLGMLKDSLKNFEYKGNDLVSPPPETLILGPKAVLEFLNDLLSGSKPIYRIKLLIVGEENVGKTTIVDQLTRRWNSVSTDEIFTPSPTLSTDGIDVSTCSFHFKNEGERKLSKYKDDEVFDVNLSFWDFAGQEVYYTTHQFFLSERSIFIVVWNMEKPIEESRVEYWLNSIQSKVSSASIFVIGNRLDSLKKEMRENLPDFLKKQKVRFRQMFGLLDLSFFCISCRTGEGVAEFKTALEEKVVKSKHIGEVLPSTYILLERHVIEERSQVPPVISKQKFIEMGFHCDISGEVELFRASNLLHNLGTLIYFEKDPVLSQFVILEPQWLAKVMATLISTKQAFLSAGILPHRLIRQIWRQYPADIYPFLLTLLEKFEVTYNLTGFIAPDAFKYMAEKTIELTKSGGSTNKVLSLLSKAKKTTDLISSALIKCKTKAKTEEEKHLAFVRGIIPKKDRSTIYIYIGNSLKRRTMMESVDKVYDPLSLNSKSLSDMISRATMSNDVYSERSSLETSSSIEDQKAYLEKLRMTSTYGEFNIQGASLIPSMLPSEKPDFLWEKWPEVPQPMDNEVNRQWTLDFVPNGLFSRLVVRLLQGFLEVGDDLMYWKYGLLIIKPTSRLFAIIDESNATIRLYTRAPTFSVSAILFCGAIQALALLFKEWNKLGCEVGVICPHCRVNNTSDQSYWVYEDVVDHVTRGDAFLTCESGTSPFGISIEFLCPDLKLVYLQNISLNYNDLVIQNEVGIGGFAVVYKGYYKKSEVAIKKLLSSTEATEDYLTAFNEFRTETFTMMDIDNLYCVKMLGVCFEPFCIVTEYIPHGNLFELSHEVDKFPEFSWDLKMKIALDMAKGMAYLHSKKPPVIHNDLKSPNVLIMSLNPSDPVCAKISDFGLSQRTSKMYKRMVDNPIWIAPEIMKGLTYDTKVDVYAYGVMLWEMVERKPYFNDIAFNSEIELRVMKGERPNITQDVIPEFEKLIRLCWENDPSKRPTFDMVVKFLELLWQKHKMGATKIGPSSEMTIPETIRQRHGFDNRFEVMKSLRKEEVPVEDVKTKNRKRAWTPASLKPPVNLKISNIQDEPPVEEKTEDTTVCQRSKLKLNIGRSSSKSSLKHNIGHSLSKSSTETFEKRKTIHTSNLNRDSSNPQSDTSTSDSKDLELHPLKKDVIDTDIPISDTSMALEGLQTLLKRRTTQTSFPSNLRSSEPTSSESKNIKYIEIEKAQESCNVLRNAFKILIKKVHTLILSVRNQQIPDIPAALKEVITYLREFRTNSNDVGKLRTWSEDQNAKIKSLHDSTHRLLLFIVTMCKVAKGIVSIDNPVNEFLEASAGFTEEVKLCLEALKCITLETGQTVLVLEE